MTEKAPKCKLDGCDIPAPAQASGREGNTLRDDLRTLRNFGRVCKVVQVGKVPYCQTHQNDHALCPPVPAPQRQEEAQRHATPEEYLWKVAEADLAAGKALGAASRFKSLAMHLRAALSASEARLELQQQASAVQRLALEKMHNRAIAAEAQATTLREALRRAELKLSAYVGVCKDDKELTNTVLPMCRRALEPLPEGASQDKERG